MGTTSTRIALTGGPGGGKSILIEELLRAPAWYGCVAVLPEAISLKREMGISPCATPSAGDGAVRMALENGLVRGLGQDHCRVSLCLRGSLYPLSCGRRLRCYRLDNDGRDWAARSREARAILDGVCTNPVGRR